jgi:hypothetical protein
MDNIAAMEEEHGVDVRTHIGFSDRAGVLVVFMEAFEEDSYPEEGPLCAYRTEWPNAQVISFTALLMQAAIKLERLVSDSRMDGFMENSTPVRYRG